MEKRDFRILVVDDEADWVTINSKVLKREGYNVDGANCAEEAIKAAKETAFHLAFLDINMPGMEGIDLIDHLREEQPGIEIVMLTGYGTEEKSSSAHQKGILDFLEKIGDSGDSILADEMVDLADEVFERISA